MSKILGKNLKLIFEKVREDDDSQLKLVKEIGKLSFCLNKHYSNLFIQF